MSGGVGGGRLRLLHEEAPAVGWRVEPLAAVRERLVTGVERCAVAVDGRSASGKTTLARRLVADAAAAGVPAVLVSTDDLAWWHDFFAWTDLLVEGVLHPWRASGAASFRPPAWEQRGREGAVVVPAGTRLLVVEGVGAGRPAHRAELDAVVWVQSDLETQLAREAERVREGSVSADLSREWLEAEAAFLARERPWEGADLVACGTPSVLGVEVAPSEVAVASPGVPRPGG